MTALEPTPLPWWVRALDVVSGVAVLLLISIVVFGGFRLRYGDLRITAQDVWRPLAVLILAGGVRHWLVPQPSWPTRMRAALRVAWAAPVTRVVLPSLLASRLMVLAVGYLGVALIGYPDKLEPPNRVSRSELVNLPSLGRRLVLRIALNGYDYDRTRGRPPSRTWRSPGLSDARRAVTAGSAAASSVPTRPSPATASNASTRCIGVRWRLACWQHDGLRWGSSTCTGWCARSAATTPRRRQR